MASCTLVILTFSLCTLVCTQSLFVFLDGCFKLLAQSNRCGRGQATNNSTDVDDQVLCESVADDAIADGTAEYLHETVTGQRIDTTIIGRTGEIEETKIVTFIVGDKKKSKN